MKKQPSQLPQPNLRVPMQPIARAAAAADSADEEDRMIISAIAMHGLLCAGGEWGPDALADAAVKKAEALLARLNRDNQAAGFGA